MKGCLKRVLGYRFPETISLLSFLPWKGIETPCFLEDRKMYSRCMMDKKKTLIFSATAT